MGYDLNRFEGNVDEELICPICSFILEDPVQAPECEHAFCSLCINQWLKHQSICPIDRTSIQPIDLKPVPRILKNLLSKLKIRCDYAPYGCQSIVRLENLNSHLQECEFNPKRPIVCSIGCDMIIAKDEAKNHNCIRELRKIVDDQQSKINQMSGEMMRQKSELDNYVNELRTLKSLATRCFRVNSPSLSTPPPSSSSTAPSSSSNSSITNLSDSQQQRHQVQHHANQIHNQLNHHNSNPQPQAHCNFTNLTDDDDIVRWSSTLPVAKVTRWGGIISTPDAVLQAVIKRALIDNSCPQSILNELMNNAHERHWPSGLSTLETRQINRNHYVNFVCRRVPNKQAVLILAADNRDLPNHLIVEPGVVLIFAHGVE